MTIRLEAVNDRELLIQIAAALNTVTDEKLPDLAALIQEEKAGIVILQSAVANHDRRLTILESKNVAAWTGGIAGGGSAIGLIAYIVGRAAGWW